MTGKITKQELHTSLNQRLDEIGILSNLDSEILSYFQNNALNYDLVNAINYIKQSGISKQTQPTPSQPTASNITHGSITVTGSEGTYVKLGEGGAGYPSPYIFTGLNPNTSYTFYAYYPETHEFLQSDNSVGLTVSTIERTIIGETGNTHVGQGINAPLPITTNKIYGLSIDKSNSNPETAVVYTDDAIGFTPANGNNGYFHAGSWATEYPFNQIRPCVFKDGIVQYYLNPTDYSKKIDGTNADITTGIDGDVMIQFPKLWWKIVDSPSHLYVKYSTYQVDSTYKPLAHTRGTTESNWIYLSAYSGWVETSTKLRSLSDKIPTVDVTLGDFRTFAQANSGYEQMTYYGVLMLQILYLMMFKNRDSQTALGRGYVDGNTSLINTGSANTMGMFYGTSNGSDRIKFCGIEDLWGNIRFFIDGLISDASRNILIGNKNFNDTGSGYVNYGVISNFDNTGFVSSVQGGTETGFIPNNFGGSSTTYYPDQADIIASCASSFGGSKHNGDSAGIFSMGISSHLDDIDGSPSVSSRLSCF